MAENNDLATVYEGQHLSMAQRGHWEFATRNTKRPAVGIVAITDSQDVVLVEQYRLPVGRMVVELPAGLAGDIPGSENEALVEAAKRELLEETGYTANEWTELGSGYSSPGLTDESIVLFLARGLEKTGPGGGDESEEIAIQEVRVGEVSRWLAEHSHSADLKLLAGLFLAQERMKVLDRK
mgnify:CR=1 FL=1